MTTTEIIPPSTNNWNIYGKDIFKIEQDIFAEKSFTEEMMKSDINDSKTNLVILKDNNIIIGFVYAMPESEGVSCVVDIAIKREYQNKGLVSYLMLDLESELKKNGYIYMTEHAMIDNGYADKIQKNYDNRIIESRDIDGEYGRQRYFKILL